MNAYDLDDWPKIPPNNLNKNCFFSATNIVKSSNKGKYISSGYGIAFDGADSWSFGNDLARIVTISCIDNSSSSHADNHKKIFFSVNRKIKWWY